MYVTRPLSMYLRDPSALSLPPPEGPNSGILVIQDEEAEPTCCFGFCKSDQIENLPFPQNKNLQVRYTTGGGNNESVDVNRIIFIPVVNQPLSSNQYYCINRRGKRKGEAYQNSKEEDMTTCCFCNCISDLKPEPLDHQDIYQQFQIQPRKWGYFTAKSVAPDGFPPYFLRRKDWRLHSSTATDFQLSEAPGLDKILRSRLPEFSLISLSQKTSTSVVVVGKWYIPFMFIKEGTLKDQISRSRYYQVTLEQYWEEIFSCENSSNQANAVNVDVNVEAEAVKIGGKIVLNDEKTVADGMMWLNRRIGEGGLGISLAIVERMRWEEERFGWIGGGEEGQQVRVNRVEKFGGIGEWKKFGCYVLVERFVLRRMDGSLVFLHEFKHTQHLRSKWE